MQARGPTALARALSDGWVEPQQRLGPAWQQPFVAGLADRMAHATLDDLVFAGYEFEPSADSWRGTVVRHGCYASIEFSAPRPDAAHRAVCIGWMNDRTVRWVASTIAVKAVESMQYSLPILPPNVTRHSSGR